MPSKSSVGLVLAMLCALVVGSNAAIAYPGGAPAVTCGGTGCHTPEGLSSALLVSPHSGGKGFDITLPGSSATGFGALILSGGTPADLAMISAFGSQAIQGNPANGITHTMANDTSTYSFTAPLGAKVEVSMVDGGNTSSFPPIWYTTIVTVPEPTTAAIVGTGIGMLALAGTRRFRRRRPANTR